MSALDPFYLVKEEIQDSVSVPTSRVLLCVCGRVRACVFLCVWFPFHLRVLRSPYFLFCYVPVWIVLFSFYGERERERDESDNNVDVLLLQEEVINGAMRDHRERERDRDRDRDRFPKRLVDLYQVWVMSKRDGCWIWESRCIATKTVSDGNKEPICCRLIVCRWRDCKPPLHGGNGNLHLPLIA